MARTTDIYCRDCTSKAVITRTERVHSDYSRLYCSCLNSKCGHKWVMKLEFGHTTRASRVVKNNLLFELIERLSEEEKQEIKKRLTE